MSNKPKNVKNERAVQGSAAQGINPKRDIPRAGETVFESTAQSDLNSRFVAGQLAIQRGDRTDPVWLKARFRKVEAAEFPVGGKVRALPRFLSVMIDKRAPGIWPGIIGGPKSKVEHLAELAVDNAALPLIADTFADHTLMQRINDSLIRGNQRFKSGVFTTDYMSLNAAVCRALGASESQADALWIVARIITELLSRAYAKLGVMVPFVGAAEISAHSNPVANLSTLIRSSSVALVTEVFEAIELGNGFDAAKEFNPAVSEALLGPLLTQAANRISNAARYDKYMSDSAVLLGRYLAAPSMLPAHLQDHADLQYLATNASFALDSLNRVNQAISTPEFDLDKALQYTVMRLREMKRFESWTLDKFASHYSIEKVLLPSGYLGGITIMRHDPIRLSGQVTRYVNRGAFTVQLPSEVGESYLSPLVEAVNHAFGGSVLQKHVSIAADELIKSTMMGDPEGWGGYVFTFGLSADEERMLGLAHARALALAGITDDGLVPPTIVYETFDNKLFYEPAAIPNGNGFMTVDPLEAIILADVEVRDPQAFPLKPQIILDEVRKHVLLTAPRTYQLDGATVPGLISLTQAVKLVLPMLDDTPVTRSDSLQELLGLAEIGELDLTVELAHRETISAAFATLAATYAELYAAGGVGKLQARAVAVALHGLVSALAEQSSFLPLMRTMMQRFLNDPAFAGRYQALRDHLSAAHVRHQLALGCAFIVLLKTGMLEFGVHEDIVRIFEAEQIVDVAVTSETWQRAMNTRA